MHILILEDDPIVALELSSLVEECGHTSSVVSGQEAALDLVVREDPDLMIADVDLGSGGDGIEAATSIRQAGGPKTIFVTGCSDPKTRDRAQRAWPLAFLKKPFDVRAFEKTLRGVANSLEARGSVRE